MQLNTIQRKKARGGFRGKDLGSDLNIEFEGSQQPRRKTWGRSDGVRLFSYPMGQNLAQGSRSRENVSRCKSYVALVLWNQNPVGLLSDPTIWVPSCTKWVTPSSAENRKIHFRPREIGFSVNPKIFRPDGQSKGNSQLRRRVSILGPYKGVLGVARPRHKGPSI